MLESVKDYYKLVQSDMTRNGIVMKKVILESVTGSVIRNACQLSQLADILGARLKTLYETSKVRFLVEENKEMTPLVEKLARKSPEGDKIISREWKLKGVHFYETNSELIKGYHCMYKVGYFVISGVLYSDRLQSLEFFCY